MELDLIEQNIILHYQRTLSRARKEMDCASMHCAGCPYLINHNCELAESLI